MTSNKFLTRKSKLKLFLTAALLVVILVSCTVGRDYQKPDTQKMEEVDLHSNTHKAEEITVAKVSRASIKAAEPVTEWWKSLNDPLLTDLIEQGLEKNYDIKIAFANIEQARALARASRSDRLPSVDATNNIARQRLSNNGISGAPADRSISTYEAGFDSAWELDLFGRVGASIDASGAALGARIAEMRSVYVMVAAEIARGYIELRAAQYRLDVAERNLDNQRLSMELTSRLAEGGRSTELDIARAKTQFRLTQSSIPPLQATVNASINRLGVLIGQSPSVLHDQLRQVQILPSVPESISIGDSTSLLQRRGDVRAAEHELVGAVAQYNINVTALYPRISLQGSIGFSSTSFSSLGTSDSQFALFGPSISWSVFNRSQIKANIAAADADANARLATFYKTVLEALEEVDTAMENFSREELRRASLIEAANSSANATRLSRQRYELGLDSFIDVLDAERTQLDAEDRLATSESQVFLYLISLYKALGGGWQLL